MAYQVLSLKWRPHKFSEVVGQEHVTATLENAFRKERIAQAYLFTGPRGVGKTTAARILAATLNCQSEDIDHPCNQCSNCQEIAGSRNMDVLEIDGASNRGIEEIRNLREMIKYAPVNATYKIFIIDEVHMLTGPAFNALLKTLEEPPPHGKFILATTDIHKVPPTIISRCQRYDFNRISVQNISQRLEEILAAEKIEFDRESLAAIARKADGSMRDGLSYLDQVIAYCGDKIDYPSAAKVLGVIPLDLQFNLTEAIRNRDVEAALKILNKIHFSGTPVVDFLDSLNQHLRSLLIAAKIQAGTGISEEILPLYQQEAANWDYRDLLRLLNMVMGIDAGIRRASHPYLQLEVLVLKMLEMDRAVSLDKVLSQMNSGQPAGVPATPPQAPKKAAPLQETPAAPPPVKQKPETAEDSAAQPEQARSKVSLTGLRKQWPKIVGSVNKDSASLGTILEQSAVLAVEGNRVTVGVVNLSNFNARRLEKKTSLITSAAEKLLSAAMRFEFQATVAEEQQELIEEPDPPEASSPPDENPQARREAVVDRIVELFDGEQLR